MGSEIKKTLLILYGPFIVLFSVMALGPEWLRNAIFIAFSVCCFAWMVVGVVIVLIVGVKEFRGGRITFLDLATGVVFGWIGAPMLARSLFRKQ